MRSAPAPCRCSSAVGGAAAGGQKADGADEEGTEGCHWLASSRLATRAVRGWTETRPGPVTTAWMVRWDWMLSTSMTSPYHRVGHGLALDGQLQSGDLVGDDHPRAPFHRQRLLEVACLQHPAGGLGAANRHADDVVRVGDGAVAQRRAGTRIVSRSCAVTVSPRETRRRGVTTSAGFAGRAGDREGHVALFDLDGEEGVEAAVVGRVGEADELDRFKGRRVRRQRRQIAGVLDFQVVRVSAGPRAPARRPGSSCASRRGRW